MNKNELRVGNIVYAFKTTYQIDETDFIGEIISTYKPIELTKEVLIQMGAVKFGGSIFIAIPNLKCELHFEIFENEIVTTLKGQFCELILDEVKYVHRLQNLYFSLTGRELK